MSKIFSAPAIILIFALMVIAARAEDPKPEAIAQALDAFIAQKSRESADNQLAASPGKHLIGDVNGDGNGDVVLLYYLLGPTFGYTSLAVFAFADGNISLKAQADLAGDADLDSVSKGKIIISGKTLGPDDPRCCPSVPYKTAFILKGAKLQEAKP
ncbi:MAG: hypothetical protein ACT4NX_07670 [Deltaproteobacteria bacterium]